MLQKKEKVEQEKETWECWWRCAWGRVASLECWCELGGHTDACTKASGRELADPWETSIPGKGGLMASGLEHALLLQGHHGVVGWVEVEGGGGRGEWQERRVHGLSLQVERGARAEEGADLVKILKKSLCCYIDGRLEGYKDEVRRVWRLFLHSRGDRVVARNGLVTLQYVCWERVLIWIHFEGEISVIVKGGDLVWGGPGQLQGFCLKFWMDGAKHLAEAMAAWSSHRLKERGLCTWHVWGEDQVFSMVHRCEMSMAQMLSRQWMYPFPIPAVTSDYKFSHLKWHRFIILGFWRRSKVLRSTCWPGRVPSGGSGGICFIVFSSCQRPPDFLTLPLPHLQSAPLQPLLLLTFLILIILGHPGPPG